MERLILKGVTQSGAQELAEGLLSVGRNPTTDIRVHDPTASSFHCEIIISGATVLVRDLNSTNGTFIDGEPVKESFLRPWQVLRLGNAEFRLEVEDVPETPEVRIPTLSQPAAEGDTHLLDGSLACLNHPGVAAVVRCIKCSRAYCGSCVQPVGLKGGQKRLFCPSCSSPCHAILTDTRPKKESLLSRLTQTIRIKLGG